MAAVASILGGITGMLSAFGAWLLFGLGFWGAVQVYFVVALLVAFGLIVLSLFASRTRADAARSGVTAERLQKA